MQHGHARNVRTSPILTVARTVQVAQPADSPPRVAADPACQRKAQEPPQIPRPTFDRLLSHPLDVDDRPPRVVRQSFPLSGPIRTEGLAKSTVPELKSCGIDEARSSGPRWC